MCKGGMCEGACSTEVAKECPVALGMLANLDAQIRDTVDTTWKDYEAAMLVEDRMRAAVNNGGSGFSLMMGQY